MKTVLFVPGFRDTIDSHNYHSVLKIFKEKGYRAEFVPINWTRTTVTTWLQTLEAVYAHYDPATTVLAGFSFGAVTAFMAATKRNPSELWLFSLSDAFAENIPTYTKGELREIGKKRAQDFSTFSFNNLVKKIHCKTLLFVGEKEAKKYPHFYAQIKEAHRMIKGSVLVEIPATPHDVTNERYLQAIKETISY